MVLKHWTIEQLNNLGYKDNFRLADERKYGFDHRARSGHFYEYRFRELIKSPRFRWLFLSHVNGDCSFENEDIDELREIYAPFIAKDKCLALELSQYVAHNDWCLARHIYKIENDKALERLNDLLSNLNDIQVSSQEIAFRDLLSILLEDPKFSDKLVDLIRQDNNRVLNDYLFGSVDQDYNPKKQNVKYQMYIISHLSMILEDFIHRSRNDERIEREYVSSDFMKDLRNLVRRLNKIDGYFSRDQNDFVTSVDEDLLEFIDDILVQVPDSNIHEVGVRYRCLAPNSDINWELLFKHCKQSAQFHYGIDHDESLMQIHSVDDEFTSASDDLPDADALDYGNSFERQDLSGLMQSSDSVDSDEEASPDDDFEDAVLSDYSEDDSLAAPSFSLLSHSESPTILEDALPMSAESSSVSDDDLLVSDSLTSTDVSEDDLSDLLVSSDSSDSQSDSQSEVSSSHSYKFHPRAKSNSNSDD